MPEDLTYGDLPPNVQAYLSRPGVNREKALQWFSLGISEPQTYNQAKLLAEAVGNSPEQAKVVAGQWQFESGGGSHVGANHNYFGIQAHTKDVRDRLSARGINVGVGELTDTPEVRNGKTVNTKNKFMEFDNAFDGFQAHRVFLETNDRYKDALSATTAKDFAKGLEKANYATAPNYGTTLYNNYVLPKEKSPLSGDKRPTSLGTTASKVKLGTSEEGQTPEIVPALPTRPVELIETNTLGVRPEISTSPAQANYIPTNSAPVVIPASEAMQMSAPKGWFGSGKSTFNAMGGTMYKQGGGIHINPAHEGDFTAKANAAGMGVQEYASKVLSAPEGQYDPSTRKQANFARNAAGWNHEMGGSLYATGGSLNNSGFNALPKEVQNKIRTNMNNKRFEAGGPMGQLTEFNSGGSHEESPLGGIPQGQAPDGGTNLVEQGETKLNAADYIFSKTLKIDKETAQEFNLKPNFVNKDFAEASKIANRKDSRRENDTIETNAIQRDLDNLMNAQEAFKQKEVQKKMEEIQALDPNALTQSYQPQGMPAQGTPQEGMPQGAPEGQPSPEEMAMMQEQGQGQPPMDPAMMQQMMAEQGAPQMPMQYGGPMSYKCGGGMYEYGGDLSRQFYGGGTMPGSNFSDSGNYYGLNNQGLTTNGSNTQQAAGNNGLSGGQYAQMGLSAVNAGANINRINKSDMSQDAKTSAYGDTASQIGDSTVQTIFPALAPAFAAKNAYQGMLTSNVNPETGEKAYKKGFQASSNEAVTPIHTRQFKGITDFAKDKSAANFGKMAWNFMDPGSAQLFDSAKGIWGKDKYAENQTAIDLNQKSQEDAYNQQQLGLQQQQQNAINTAVQAGLAGYQQQDNPNSNFAKYGGHQFPALTPTYKDNAGPMGQGLNNLYAMGGMFDGPGDPPVTAAATHPLSFTQQSYKNSSGETVPYSKLPWTEKVAVNRGAGFSAAMDAEGNLVYTPASPASMGWFFDENQSSLDFNKTTQFSDNGKTSDDINGRDTRIASGEKATHIFDPVSQTDKYTKRAGKPWDNPASPRVVAGDYSIVLNPNDYSVKSQGAKYTGKWEDMEPKVINNQSTTPNNFDFGGPVNVAAPAGTKVNPDYSKQLAAYNNQIKNSGLTNYPTPQQYLSTQTVQPQTYLEQAANSPGAIATQQATNEESLRNQNLIDFMTEEQKAEMRGLKQTPENYLGKKGLPFNQAPAATFAMGGNMNHYFDGISGPSQMFTSDFPSMYQGNTGLTTGAIGNPNLHYMAPGSKGLDTPIEGFKTGQDTVKSNYEHKESPGAFLANMAPLAYNAYQGWIAKQMPLPENMAYHYDALLQNANPQKRAAQEEAAHAYAALRNMGNPGAVAANLGNISHQNALARAEIEAANENINNLAKTEAAKYNNKSKVDANLMKWQLQAQMLNAKAEAQKEALTGVKDYSNMQTQNALASDYNAMAGEGNYTYENTPYLQGLRKSFATSQAARNKKKEDNKTV